MTHAPLHLPLTDKLLNFDSTYLLDVASIIGRSLVQLLGLRSKALGYRERRWEQPAVQLARRTPARYLVAAREGVK